MISELENYLTIDEENQIISFNALEILTRDLGLKQSLIQLQSRIESSVKLEQSYIQTQIVEEL